jgi:hypothetical protein
MEPIDILIGESELRERRSLLSQEKGSIESRLALLTAKVRGKLLPREEYLQICDEQLRAKRALYHVNQSLTSIKLEIQKLNTEKDFIKLSHGCEAEVIVRLQAIREKYSLFAQDSTRISSMRLMASQFVSELEEAMKIQKGGLPNE